MKEEESKIKLHTSIKNIGVDGNIVSIEFRVHDKVNGVFNHGHNDTIRIHYDNISEELIKDMMTEKTQVFYNKRETKKQFEISERLLNKTFEIEICIPEEGNE